jgi:hypothetical protein
MQTPRLGLAYGSGAQELTSRRRTRPVHRTPRIAGSLSRLRWGWQGDPEGISQLFRYYLSPSVKHGSCMQQRSISYALLTAVDNLDHQTLLCDRYY